MSFTVNARNHNEWKRNGLQDFGDFAECVEYVNEREFADHNSGDWFYIPDTVLPPMEGVDYEGKTPNERAIYFGSYGNDNSPGASDYTNAEIFDMDDPEDVAEFEKRKAEWEGAPESLTEYAECGKCHESFDKDTMTEIDGVFYCEGHEPDADEEDDKDEADE